MAKRWIVSLTTGGALASLVVLLASAASIWWPCAAKRCNEGMKPFPAIFPDLTVRGNSALSAECG
jgi:hypothetical protein